MQSQSESTMNDDTRKPHDDELDADAVDATPVDEMTELHQQVGELKERLLRSQAEFDNVRKRLRREADEAGTRAVVRFCRPVLDQLDNLTRALSVANPESFNDFAQGVSMIREGLLQALTAQGIEQIPSEGIFDPTVHEVLAEVENDEVAKGTIIDIHRAGFRLKEQLIRTAQVVVARPPA